MKANQSFKRQDQKTGILAMLMSPFTAWKRDESGEISINFGLTIIGTIIGAVVAIAIVAALFPTYMGSLSDLGTAFNDPNTTTGDATADTLLPVFALLVAFGGLFAIVGIVLLAVKLHKGK